MIRAMMRRLFPETKTPIPFPPVRPSRLQLETLEARDVPSSGIPGPPSASDLDPSITAAGAGGTFTITSPDGSQTATIINQTNGTTAAEVLLNGKVIWQLPNAAVGEALFCPDGKHLALVVDSLGPNGSWGVMEYSAATGLQPVGTGYGSVSWLTFSPDGAHLGYVVVPNGTVGDDRYSLVVDGTSVSGNYYAIDDLQFKPQAGQVGFEGYLSESVPDLQGIFVPDFIVFNESPLSGPGVWGNVASPDRAYPPIPIDPVQVQAPIPPPVIRAQPLVPPATTKTQTTTSSNATGTHTAALLYLPPTTTSNKDSRGMAAIPG